MYVFHSCAKKEGEEENCTPEKENRSPHELSTQAVSPAAAAAAAAAAAPHHQLLRGACLYGL